MSQIVMPQAGQSMEEGTIVRWHKAEGDAVAKGEVLFEIETDKSVIEVEASEAGVLRRILVGEGKTVPIKTPVAELEKPGEEGQRTKDKGQRTKAEPASPSIPSTSSIPSTVRPVLMPKAGQSMEEGTLVKWRVAPGAAVKRGEVIFEVETDKSVVEVEATEDGRVARIVAPEGAVVPVLQPVAYLAERDEDVEAFLAAGEGKTEAGPSTASLISTASTSSTPTETPAEAVTTNASGADEGVRAPSGRMKASPAARKLAREHGIELEKMGQGSGPGGRILTGDVARMAANVRAEARTPNEARAEARTPNAGRADEAVRGPRESAIRNPQSAIEPYHPVQPKSGQTVRTKMSPMRRAIARNLLASKQTIPHWYLERVIDADPMMAFYRARKAQYPCSVNDVIVLAVSRSIMEFPEFRCRVEGEEVVEFPSVNIGIAVGLEAGLVVPVVVGVERMNLRQLGAESKRLAELARTSGKVENMGKGIFTVSNMGMFGVDRFMAIINPPEAAILAVAAVREEAIVRGGMMRPGRTLSLTLSADHRLIDGLAGAKFMARLKEMLEEPEGFLI